MSELTPGPPVRYVCSACQGELLDGDGLACARCAAHYTRLEAGFADFGAGEAFEDWFAQDPAALQRWLSEEAPLEDEFQASGARRFTMPLLASLGYRPGSARVLSAGCGLGADVDALNEEGYAAWGIDCGNRTRWWSRRRHAERLARADAAQLPFPDGSFELVMAINLLEHIGVVGDTTQVTPDHEERRLATVRSLLRVTSPGGYLVLSGMNRQMPLDPAHVQDVRSAVRVHSPWEHFLLSYGDARRLALATGYAGQIRPLPLRGFFAWTHLRHNALARPLLPLVDWLLGSLPPWLYASPLSPFWIALVQRRGDTGNRQPSASP